MVKESTHCKFKKCKGLIHLIYKGTPLCSKHWRKICERKTEVKNGTDRKDISSE